MLVDNPIFQQSYFTSGSSSSFPEYPTELNDIFDTELFNNTFVSFGNNSVQSSPPSGSRDSSPHNVLTPPQDILPTSFPEVHDDEASQNNFFSLYDDDMKVVDSMSAMPPTDFLSLSGMGIDGAYGGGAGGYDINMNTFNMGMPMDMSALGVVSMHMEDPTQARGIDPQLVDTPSAISDQGDDESDEKESPESPVENKDAEKPSSPTITIAPVKVGGHGKARKGTVQSGGVVKKTATSAANKEKENSASSFSTATKKALAAKTSATAAATTSITGPFLTSGNATKSSNAESEAGDNEDDDDLPHDWRPSPEVFAKMTSKEKRQLRNKISARNFRVRRKEYISTLEGDIAERDRMLDHYRTQLGSTESENLALRQEIAALKKALLDGRNGPINLPPPAPLPEQSAAEALAAAASTSSSATSTSSPLLTPNTQKDLPASSSPRMSNRFWGGLGVGGGFTPVHTTLVPDVSSVVRRGLQENMNPALNGPLTGVGSGLGVNKGLSGFDGFSDLNPFTMKTLDAYRMHLWGKMAAQHHHQNQNHSPSPPSSPPTNTSGLASNMRPHFFTPSSKANLPSTYNGSSTTLSALLSGKQASSMYPSPPSSPQINPKLFSVVSSKEREMQQQREKEQQQAMLAAMASQTVFRKLGSAFWDAFTGGSSSASSSSTSSTPSNSGSANWDADKVQRVLSGKAVLKVVDVEPSSPPATPKLMRSATMPVASASKTSLSLQDDSKKCCSQALTDILEESMRSLTLGKKM